MIRLLRMFTDIASAPKLVILVGGLFRHFAILTLSFQSSNHSQSLELRYSYYSHSLLMQACIVLIRIVSSGQAALKPFTASGSLVQHAYFVE